MLKVYTGEKLDKVPHIPILFPNWGVDIGSDILFLKVEVFGKFKEKFVEVVSNAEESDYLLIPHNYFKIKNNKECLDKFISLSKEHNKKIIVYAYGDSSEDIDLENSIILRSSRYKSELKENEIIIPAYSPEIQKKDFRSKKEKPVVGFVGWAGFKEFKKKIKVYIKDLFQKNIYKKNGVTIRKNILDKLSKSDVLKTNFIIRDTFSRHPKTISLDPKQARKDFVDNVYESDLLLSVKGDGNFSVRFFEILSAGRIPLFIDTDCALPLENEIDYDSFIFRIDYKDISNIDNLIKDFWNNLSEEDYKNMQDKANAAFKLRLDINQFFKYLFSDFDGILERNKY